MSSSEQAVQTSFVWVFGTSELQSCDLFRSSAATPVPAAATISGPASSASATASIDNCLSSSANVDSQSASLASARSPSKCRSARFARAVPALCQRGCDADPRQPSYWPGAEPWTPGSPPGACPCWKHKVARPSFEHRTNLYRRKVKTSRQRRLLLRERQQDTAIFKRRERQQDTAIPER